MDGSTMTDAAQAVGTPSRHELISWVRQLDQVLVTIDDPAVIRLSPSRRLHNIVRRRPDISG